jgi:hypothetical protein
MQRLEVASLLLEIRLACGAATPARESLAASGFGGQNFAGESARDIQFDGFSAAGAFLASERT